MKPDTVGTMKTARFLENVGTVSFVSAIIGFVIYVIATLFGLIDFVNPSDFPKWFDTTFLVLFVLIIFANIARYFYGLYSKGEINIMTPLAPFIGTFFMFAVISGLAIAFDRSGSWIYVYFIFLIGLERFKVVTDALAAYLRKESND